ncbi:MAG: hypothetical protein ACYDC1_16410 [Limisphaerales bacterium]
MKTRFNGSRRRIALAGLILASAARVVMAQDLSDVLPELKTLPAPPSIHEGLRLSYYSSVASVPPSFLTIWPDENGFVTPSASGHGYTQVDVVGLTPQLAGLSVAAWQYHVYTGPLVPIAGGTAALIGHAGGGDWWIHPQVLAKVENVSEPGLTILRMAHRLKARTYNVLRIQREIGNARHALSYDLESGYLIYKSGTVKNGDNTMVSQAYFAGTRQLRLPWAAQILPDWVVRGQRLRYEGTHTLTVFGSGEFALPLSADVEITGRTGQWCVFDQTVTLGGGGAPDTVERTTLVTGANHLSGLCLSIAALGTLQAGQVIDTDEVTGAKVEVGWVGQVDNGRPGVRLRFSGTAFWSETTFDATTGVAVRLRTYEGASELYRTESEVNLVSELVPPPPAPRLEIAFDHLEGSITVRCPTAGAKGVTLRRSTDGGLTWVAVPGWEDQACAGTPVIYQDPNPVGFVLYSASLR